jgi:branched-subunit amino acid aminotransferase/4-amino-4-deoxychorismate lyase
MNSRHHRLGFTPWLGVFETLKVERGEAQFVQEHWESLQASAAALGLKITVDFRKKKIPATSGRWRWVVRPEKSESFFQRQEGRRAQPQSISISPLRVGRQNWDARYKTVSYLTHWQARQQASTDEVILLNEKGQVASGAMSNIFWTKAGRVYTPALDCGCRAGVIRSQIMKFYQVREVRQPASVLRRAEQIFITNSWIGCCPVQLVDAPGFGTI